METQPLPSRVGPIIPVVSLGLFPALDEDLGELPIQCLPWSENDIQGSLGGLLWGQIRHVAAAQIGLHPLMEPIQHSVCMGGGRARLHTPGASAMNVKPSFS